jgi:hypothetical protein
LRAGKSARAGVWDGNGAITDRKNQKIGNRCNLVKLSAPSLGFVLRTE